MPGLDFRPMDIGCIDLSGRVVLIVEDQLVLAFNLQIAIEEAGAEAIVARGPQEARARLQQFRFSAAIIDPGRRLMARELEERKVPVVAKVASRGELLARLARAA
jgi:DNA-binding response OmpR family regulator